MSEQHEWEVWLRSNERMSWIKMHPFTGFCFLSCDVFMNIFPLKLFIFIWNTMNYFFIVKVVVTSSQHVTCSVSMLLDITANTHCHDTMGRWRCLCNYYVTSQWVCDIVIDTKQSCDQQPGSFTQELGKPGYFTQDPGGMKTLIFYFKNWF